MKSSGERPLRVLFVGDVVGRAGREALARQLERVRAVSPPDLVVVNGENAAGGFGLTEAVFHELLSLGVDVVTLGNHAWDKPEILRFISEANQLVRPLNFPDGSPGRGWTIRTVEHHNVAVVNMSGRVFMPAPLDCPFRAIEKTLPQLETPLVIVDFHAEATAEKKAMGHFLDGRVSAVLGTHTHVQTADDQILPGGTAYISDVGMTGPFESVIGMKIEGATRKMVQGLPGRLETAEGPAQFNAVMLHLDAVTGKALTIERLNCPRG